MAGVATKNDWQAKAREFIPHDRPYIDGAFADSSDSRRYDSNSPTTGGAICALPVGSRVDVDRAVSAARRAFDSRSWLGLGLTGRKQVLLRAAALIEQRRDEFALIETLEVGKAISNAHAEIGMSIDWLRFYAEAIDKFYGAVAPSDGELFAFSLTEPRGVVGAIVPWNFPLANAVMKVAPALAAGNSVVLKPSEIATQSALYLAELMTEAGLPAGVLNVVPGLGHTVG
jgi:gamma-glutamyl-gamma-aminobutyraldehyde dehydrogenase